jgi:hypothetical protein
MRKRRIKLLNNKYIIAGSACHLLSRWFLARLILGPWRWRLYIPPKRRWLSTDYTALYPRRWYSSEPPMWEPQTLRIHNHTESEIVLAMTMKSTIFWYAMPCSLVEIQWRFGKTYCLYFQDGTLFLAHYFWNPENVGSMFLRNVGELPDYTASYPTKQYPSQP